MSVLEALKAGLKTSSAAGTQAVGIALAREVFARGGTLALYGDLGAGKTTLVRGIAEGLGFSDITSPSFNYYFLYQGPKPMLHLDAYRLNAPQDYPSLMIDELLVPHTTFVVEWPEKLGEYLPKDAIKLELTIVGEGEHLIKLR